MTIKSINGCIGCEECVKSCPCDVIRMEPVSYTHLTLPTSDLV